MSPVTHVRFQAETRRNDRWRLALVAVLLTGVAACGGGSGITSPSVRIPLRNGPYWLHLDGVGFSLDPDLPACENAIAIRGATGVVTAVDLTNANGTWIARSAVNSGAQLELRFTEGTPVVFDVPVAGTIAGVATDMVGSFQRSSTGVRISVRGSTTEWADMSGRGHASQDLVTGTVVGSIQFTDMFGNVSTCTKILLNLVPRAA